MILQGSREKLGKIKILITDSNTKLRQSICSLLALHQDFEVLSETSNGTQTLKEALKLKPDLVLMDIDISDMNGFEVMRNIKRKLPGVKLMVLSMHRDDECILKAFEAGVSGYVLKDVAVEELARAIRAVHNDQYYLCPSISRTLVEAYLRNL